MNAGVRRKAWVAAVLAVTLLSCRTTPTLPPNVTILPEPAMPGLVDGFHEPRIESIQGYWRPAADDIATAHKRIFTRIVPADFDGSRPISEYYAQYAGLIVNGERVIYGSFVHEWTIGTPPMPRWRDSAVHGDPMATGLSWGILYHPTTDVLDPPVGPWSWKNADFIVE